MAHAIWNGVISFGLLNIPVSLHPGERSTDLHFRMLDSRDNSPVRFERVNAETGEEVPWKQIVKAFEYEKGNYVVLQQEDFKAAAPDSLETVEIESFVDRAAINPMYFEKPYYLVPAKKAEKGYVLLREVLRKSDRIAMGKVVIRTREYLCGLMPLADALVLVLLRFPQEIVSPEEFKVPGGGVSKYRISDKEVAMAEQLVESMTVDFEPSAYVDDFRTRLREVIDTRIRTQEGTVTTAPPGSEEIPEKASTNVVDFMALLRKSLGSKKKVSEGSEGSEGSVDAKESGAGKPSSAVVRAGSKSAAIKDASKTGSKSGSKSDRKPAGTKTAATRKSRTMAAKSIPHDNAARVRKPTSSKSGKLAAGTSGKSGIGKSGTSGKSAPHNTPKQPARKRAA